MKSILSLVHSLDNVVGNYFAHIRTPQLTAFFKSVTLLGNVEVIIPLLIIAIIFLTRKKKIEEIIALLCTVGSAEAVCYAGKLLFHRLRPLHGVITETDFSFPSGHATVAVAFYGCIVFLLIKRYKSLFARFLIISAAVLLILLIGISRLYLGVHYASDIIAGYMVGALSLLFIGKLYSSIMLT